jgi:hypothetical protein
MIFALIGDGPGATIVACPTDEPILAAAPTRAALEGMARRIGFLSGRSPSATCPSLPRLRRSVRRGDVLDGLSARRRSSAGCAARPKKPRAFFGPQGLIAGLVGSKAEAPGG